MSLWTLDSGTVTLDSGVFTWDGFGPGGGETGVGHGRHRKPFEKPRPPIYRHPEEVEREQQMLAEYLRDLEKNAKHRAGARERKKAGFAPHLTDAMARAASAEQLQTIAGAATAALLDRQKAAEEQRRRGLMAILLLALD